MSKSTKLAPGTAHFEKRLANLEECAAATGLSTFWWRRKAKNGEVESVKMGTRLMIPVSEIDRIIAENTRPRVA